MNEEKTKHLNKKEKMKRKRKQISGMITLALLVCGGTLVNAQQVTDSGTRISAGFDLSIPAGNFSKNYDGGYGLFAAVELPLSADKFYVTVTTGVNQYFAKEDADDTPLVPDMTVLPLKAGIKYFPVKHLYVQGEAGASFLTNSSDFAEGKAVSFVFAPQVGYLLPLGKQHNLDVGVRFEGRTRSFEAGEATYLTGIKLGYTFQF